jgi:hypothetical protein
MVSPSQAVAREGVADRQREKAEPDREHDEIQHGLLLSLQMALTAP